MTATVTRQVALAPKGDASTAHDAPTRACDAALLFECPTRAQDVAPTTHPLLGVDTRAPDSAALTSWWVTPRAASVPATELAVAVPPAAHDAGPRWRRERGWWIAGVVVVAAAIAVGMRWSGRSDEGPSVAPVEARREPNVITETRKAPLTRWTQAQRDAAEADAVDAMLRGDRARALKAYRLLAQQTGDPVMARIALILERTP